MPLVEECRPLTSSSLDTAPAAAQGECVVLALTIAASAVGYLVCFTSASVDARRGSGLGRAAAFAVGLIGVAALAVLALLATIANGLRCDESCNENLVPQARSPGWWNNVNAWQWHFQWIVALAALLFAVGAVVLLALRKERPASLAAAITTGCVAAWLIIDLS